jgi:hypothetical protein
MRNKSSKLPKMRKPQNGTLPKIPRFGLPIASRTNESGEPKPAAFALWFLALDPCYLMLKCSGVLAWASQEQR